MATSTTAPKGQGASSAQAPAQQGPFRRGTQPTVLATGYTNTTALVSATQDLPQWQLPPSNILRCIYLEVSASATGNSATVAFASDAPLNVFSTVNFTDAGGTSIVGSFDSYTLATVQKYGGYSSSADMRNSAVYSAVTGSGSTAGSFNMVFRIPVEIVNRTGVGALENTSTNSPLQLNLTLNSSANIYSTAPTTLPSVKVTARLGGYWQGPPSSNAQAPKNFGTTQYWNRASVMGLSGSANETLPNLGLGSPLRTEVYLNYATGGARSAADFPDPLEVDFRGNKLVQYSQNLWKDEMSRNYGYSATTLDVANGLDTGVFVIPFDADFGLEPGAELGNGYLSTNVGDPITLIGTWNASSTLYVVRNFLAVKGATSSIQSAS